MVGMTYRLRVVVLLTEDFIVLLKECD